MELDALVTAVQAVLSVIKDVYRIEAAYLVPQFSQVGDRVLGTAALVIKDLPAFEPGDMMDLMRTLSNIKCGRGHTICLLPRLYGDVREIEPELLARCVALLLNPCKFAD